MAFSCLASEDYQINSFLFWSKTIIKATRFNSLFQKKIYFFKGYSMMGPTTPLFVTFWKYLIIPNGAYQPARSLTESRKPAKLMFQVPPPACYQGGCWGIRDSAFTAKFAVWYTDLLLGPFEARALNDVMWSGQFRPEEGTQMLVDLRVIENVLCTICYLGGCSTSERNWA